MMPIGRWERPVDRLVARGLLERADRWNNFINAAGRAALEAHDDALFRDMADAAVRAEQAGEVEDDRPCPPR